MAINVSIQYNSGFSPTYTVDPMVGFSPTYTVDPMVLPSGTRLYATKSFFLCLQPLIPPRHFDIPPPLTGGCSEGLGAF